MSRPAGGSAPRRRLFLWDWRRQRAHGAREAACCRRRRRAVGVIAGAERGAHVLTVAAKSAGAPAAAPRRWRRVDGAAADQPARRAHAAPRPRGSAAASPSSPVARAAARPARRRRRSPAAAAAAGGGGAARASHLPGQGSQCPRMGEGLYRGDGFRAHVDRMRGLCRPRLRPPRAALPVGGGAVGGVAARCAHRHAARHLRHRARPRPHARRLGRRRRRPRPIDRRIRRRDARRRLCRGRRARHRPRARGCRRRRRRARCSPSPRPPTAPPPPPPPGKLWLAAQHGGQVLARSRPRRGGGGGAEGGGRQVPRAAAQPRVPHAAHGPPPPPSPSGSRRCVSALAQPLLCNGIARLMEAVTARARYWAVHVATAVRWPTTWRPGAEGAGARRRGRLGNASHRLPSRRRPIGIDDSTPATRRQRTPTAPPTPRHSARRLARCGGGRRWTGRYHAGERYVRCGLPTYREPAATGSTRRRRCTWRPVPGSRRRRRRSTLPPLALPPPVEPLLQRLKPAAAERKWATAYCLAYAAVARPPRSPSPRARRPSGLRSSASRCRGGVSCRRRLARRRRRRRR